MKKIFLLSMMLLPFIIYSQNIKCEITDYVKDLNGKEYFTYNYVNASYSYSRSFVLIVANSEQFTKVSMKIPKIFLHKQEYTDVYLLGIKDFNKEKISEEEQKIIINYVRDIIKYRVINNLPTNTEEYVLENVRYLKKEDDLCKILICTK